MKKLIIFILINSIILSLLYLTVAFAELTIDFVKWPKEARIFISIMFVFCFMISSIIYILTSEN